MAGVMQLELLIQLKNLVRCCEWVSRNGYTFVVCSALIFGLMIRMAWNILPAMNGSGTGQWDMTGGSDPWYMKRAVDYVVMHQSHFILDADRYYPLGGVNPRPPLFTWCLALGEDVDGDGVVLEFINNEWVFDPDDVNEIDDDDDGWVDNFVGYDPAMNDKQMMSR